MKKIVFLGLCIVLNMLVGYAQPTNIDFNAGNLNGWTYTEGGNLDSYLMTMSNPTTSTQYSIMTTGATETNTVPITMTSPIGGDFIRMGLPNIGGAVHKLTQTFRVTSASQALAISYAMVLQDGGHSCNEQPYFNFVIKDSVGSIIGNSNSHYSLINAACSSGDPSFITSGTFSYKNWVTSTFSLANYVSTNITVEYMVSGCVVTQGGHIGYAYVDASICNNSFSPNILSVNTNTYNLLQSQNRILVCGTTTANIVAPPGATSYSWTGAGISGLATQSVSITQAGTYSLVFDNASACSNTTGVTFSVGLNPIVSITASSNTVCANGVITMTATGASSYSWTPVVGNGNYFSHKLTVYPISSTVYTAIATGTNGCSGNAQYSITVASSPTLAITGNTNVCLGNSTLLTVTGADTYTWTANGALTNTILVTPTITTNYYVTGKITGTGCTEIFVTPVTVNGDISINPATKKICLGDSILITATGATSYTWSTGANTNTISLKPTATTNYTLFWAIPACGTYSTVFTVTVNPLPNLSITNSNPVCSGKQLTVSTTFSPSTTYTWSNGASSSGTIFTPSASAVPYTFTCSVAATNSLSCKSSATATITVNPSPNLVSNFPVSICIGNTYTLNFSGANTYSLNNVSVAATGSTISPTTNTTYTFVGLSLNGCSSSTVNSVLVNTSAPTNILPTTSFTVTPGSTFNLPLGSSADTYTTNAPNTFYDPILKYYVCGPITSSVTQIYTVTGTNACGTSSGTFQVIAATTSSLNQSEFWSMTSGGGAGGVGAIFKTDGTGSNPILEFSFSDYNDGAIGVNNCLTEAPNGMLYGLTTDGSVNMYGTLYQYDPATGVRTKKRNFLAVSGVRPVGQLLKASDGMLYGLTLQGGLNGMGVLFQYDPVTDIYTSKIDFNGAANGKYPYGSLIQASDGKLYGMTSEGGLNNLGVLFQYDITSNTLVKKIDFDGTNLGGSSTCTLLQAADGKLYGMTNSGGANNLGVLFQYNISTNAFVKKVDFDGANKGSNPCGALMQASNGKLYGLTKNGGAPGYGTMFQYDTGTNTFTKTFDFDGTAKGANPQGSLMQASDGKLYGLTVLGGINNVGVVFQFDISTSTFTKKYDFDGPGGNGSSPYGTLMQATDGNLYGTTIYGVAPSGGLFQYNPVTSVLSKKADFGGANDGKNPMGSLLYASDGMLYGMTRDGGNFNKGVLFQYDPITHVFTKKITFDGPINGGNPTGSLMQASDGKLYGMTYNGGTNNFGVLFQYDVTSNTYTKKFDFNNTVGKNPNGALMQASDGKLYGLTTSGGIIQYDIVTNTCVLKAALSAITNGGADPQGSLVQANDGKLYGMAHLGGAFGWGTIFQYDINSNIAVKKIDFTPSANTGASPRGSLVLATDGNLYGMTSSGGVNNVGIMFQYNPLTNAIAKKIDFSINSSIYGDDPYGSLLQASNGKLYGLTSDGNNGAKGTLYEYDFNNNVYNFKFRFSITNGAYPYYSHLIEIGAAIRTQTVSAVQCLGSSVNVSYTIGGTYNSGNIFTAQLSDASGSFASPIDIGSYMSTSNGAITATIPSSVNAGTGYRIRVVSSDPIVYGTDNGTNISISALPIPTITLNSGSVCTGSSYTFSPTGGVTYTYSSGSSVVSPTTNTSYTVTGTNAGGCSNTATAAVSVNPLPIISVNNGTVCSGNSFTIIPTGASTYSFSGGLSIVSPTANTSYTVVGTDMNNCTATAVSSVLVNALPTLSISGTNSICIGSSANISVLGASTYSWNTGTITPTISLMPLSTTIYTVMGTDANGCTSIETVSINVMTTCQDVWPGDANSDGTADNLDVLELGLHYTQTGAPRAATSNNWQSYFANNWVGTITNGSNLNHSDCNGDGTINDDDTLAIYNNYGLTHAFKPGQTNTTINPQLTIVPDQAMVVKGTWGTASIYLGDATNTINNVNGVALTVDFDNTLIEPSNVWIEFQNSFIDAGQNLYFRKLDFTNSKLFTASTHTVSNNVSGFGKIATLHYQIKSSLSSDEILTIGISQANQSDAFGIITPLTSGTGTLIAIGASVGIQENSFGSNVLISPNPTNGLLNISFNTLPQNTKIELYNSIGALVLTKEMSNKNNTINVSELSSGIYFMKVLEGNNVVVVKKVVRE